LTQSWQAYEKLGDEKNVANLWKAFGITYRNWGKYAEAVQHYQEAYTRFEALQDASSIANVQCELGITYRECVKYAESLLALKESQKIYEQGQLIIGLIGTLRAEARTLIAMNDHAQAVVVAAQALSLAEKHDLREESAHCHAALIEAYGGDNQIESARAHFAHATKLYQDLGHELDRADATREMAKIERDRGDQVVAKSLLEQALAIYEAFNRPVKTAKTLRELGLYHQKVGDQAQAQEKFQQAIALFRNMQMESEIEKTLKGTA
jgi:tetratricopeptide (TPR) repeat protein